MKKYVYTINLFVVFVVVVVLCGASTRLRVVASPYGAPRSHSLDTPQSVGLLWKSDQPNAHSST